MSLDRAQVIDFCERKGYQISPKTSPGYTLYLSREGKCGCLGALFGMEAPRLHVGDFDLARNQINVYGQAVRDEMTEFAHSLEAHCADRIHVVVINDELNYDDSIW